jgi:AbrB family looped-hinge helix DNA binding protein
MTTTIDKAGRVVIPASMREKAGFTPGSELEVLIDDLGIRLVRKVSGPVIVQRGNRLVAEPTVPLDAQTEIDVAALIEEERNRWP